ncbi:MAG: transposase [Magnetovibrio sp.]|nr:transposase [Magnetovibrio sp.]
MISSIIHVLQSGGYWRDYPAKYGPSTTVYKRYNRWAQKEIWHYMFAELTP